MNYLQPASEHRLTDARAAAPARVIIENVWPRVDDGSYPIKRIVGDRLEVWADIFRDGHDKLAASLWSRITGDDAWTLTPMRPVDNDRWMAEIPLERMGLVQYRIEAWTDHFGSWRADTEKKRAAGQSLVNELVIGRGLLLGAISKADDPWVLKTLLAAMDEAPDDMARATLLLAETTMRAMDAVPDRTDCAESALFEVIVDRERALFSSWYEMFPRSQGNATDRSGTFADCAARVPAIRALGFDVLYLPPIHPIGVINRKGRNNAVRAEPGDPGSPYAIGSAEGGHTAIHPALGTLDDFRQFQQIVHDHDMELALDFAVQCAPDHPWLKEHPNWFRRNPDGSIKFAENPPKKYEDIVNLDFDQPDWQGLWHALRDVVLFWADEGVRIFRVDNPHTKPAPFWRWLIADIKSRHPDTLFLAEAFTRPKPMRHLAKIGFSQSYTYFTWRNTKAELIEYLTELTQSEMREYFRPNFFANTPDILPAYLQESGRAGFRIRLVLAATLSPTYGIYSGFELGEAASLPGREEYADSEKYEIKSWDWDRPGHIKTDITCLNRLRREAKSLQKLANLTFHAVDHETVLCYSKRTGMDWVLVLVNLDPVTPASFDLAIPHAAFGLAETEPLIAEEVLSGERISWDGPRQRIALDPTMNPTMVLHVRHSVA